MPLGLRFIRCLSIVDDGYKPVPVVPDVEDYEGFHRIDILKRSTEIIVIVPANRLDNGGPSFDFVRCIWVAFHRLLQVLTRNDMH